MTHPISNEFALPRVSNQELADWILKGGEGVRHLTLEAMVCPVSVSSHAQDKGRRQHAARLPSIVFFQIAAKQLAGELEAAFGITTPLSTLPCAGAVFVAVTSDQARQVCSLPNANIRAIWEDPRKRGVTLG